jgi:class 3 adenylate cyclase
MSYSEVHYCWEYDLKSSPEQIWPFVADTNRFNRDTGVPSVEPTHGRKERLRNARRRLRLSFLGLPVEWEEQPFEWVRPLRFGVARNYSKGPVAELRALAELKPLETGGSKLRYEVWMRPKTLLGAMLVPFQIKLITSRRFERVFKKYDQIASSPALAPTNETTAELPPGATDRIASATERLQAQAVNAEVIDRLTRFVQDADDFSVSRIRPYELADLWKMARREVLAACLYATRAGLLDLQWDILCPLCRGTNETGTSLRDINTKVHCETCRIDFTANLDRYVEITFRPNPAIRPVQVKEFCIGNPQKTPHVVAQQLLPARTSRVLELPLEPGNYRLRALELSGEHAIKVSKSGAASGRIAVADSNWDRGELHLSTRSSLELDNETDAEQLLILERLAWNDQAATAAEVTALQIFRDLFSSEALRPGEQISVGTLTVLFTDLRNSTRLYRDIGDATAFGRVMNHFDVLKKEIADENGALVKTIGDAVMAVFRSPAAALRAMLRAQQFLANPPEGTQPLTLKAGIHTGPCIAVTLNDRLDYFGSTINMAARLEGLSTGNDVILSSETYNEAEVRELIGPPTNLQATPFEIELKGFPEERFSLWRVQRRESAVGAEALLRATGNSI